MLGLLGWVALAAVGCSGGGGSGSGSGGGDTSDLKPVPEGQRIPNEVLTDAAQGYNGNWKATWNHDSGASGSAEVGVQIDASARKGSLSLDLADGFFGPGSAATSGSVSGSLDVVAYEKPPYTIPTSVLGTVTLTGPGSLFVQIETTSIPSQPNVTSFTAKGVLTGPALPPDGSLPFLYTIALKDGTKVTGSAAFNLA